MQCSLAVTLALFKEKSMKSWQKAAFFIIGALLLWFITLTLQSFAHSGPDRSNLFQIPLAILIIIVLPGVAGVLRRRSRAVPILLLFLQLGAYVVYETGVSIETNIRSDLIFIYIAILYTAWCTSWSEDVGKGEGK